MEMLKIGTCVRHTPQTKLQTFIGSGAVFALDSDTSRCSLVLLQGVVVPSIAIDTLFNGSWLISERTMTAGQIRHLLANAWRVLEWSDGAHSDRPIHGMRAIPLWDLLDQASQPAAGRRSQDHRAADRVALPDWPASQTH